jgi:hypothetical protein
VPAGIIVVGGLFAGVTEKALPLQMVVFCGGITGVGLTVTVTVKVAPVQPPDVGVTV